jgi:hypothetical protein
MSYNGWILECQVCDAIVYYGPNRYVRFYTTQYGKRHPCQKCNCMSMRVKASDPTETAQAATSTAR